MSLTGDWLKQLESYCEDNERVFITDAEFEAQIGALVSEPHSPLLKFDFQIDQGEPFQPLSLGVASEDGPTELHTLDPFDNHGSTCRIRIWRKPGVSAEEISAINQLLERFVASYWKKDLRDEKGVIGLQNPLSGTLADNTIEKYMAAEKGVCVFFCDLDHFKQVNDTYSMAEGDRVLRELASLISREAASHAVTLRRSGDEFILLYPGAEVDQALLLATEVLEAVATHDFKLAGIEVRLSAGITKAERESVSYKELEQRAEKTTKVGGEIGKYRGVVRFQPKDAIPLPRRDKTSIDTALCVVKSSVTSERPFESPWLNMVSRFVFSELMDNGFSVALLQDRITTLLTFVQPDLDQTIQRSSVTYVQATDFRPTFSTYDLLLAVAHGVLRAGLYSRSDLAQKSLIINHDNWGDNCCLRLMPDDAIISGFKEMSRATDPWDLGGFIAYSGESVGDIDSRRALLIKIGHSRSVLPSSLFTDVIIVDDRPTAGGGLPDFWEATIARLISRINGNPNIGAVYLVGNLQLAEQTTARLTSLESWGAEAEEISYKTGIPVQSVSNAAERLSGKVELSKEEDVIDSLTPILIPYNILKPVSSPIALERSYRFLEREIKLDRMSLGRDDGCRLETIAQAYPVVLDIARRAPGENIMDQAGQALKELVDFKVVLTNPTKDLIPSFYWEEEPSLSKYFEKEFLSPDGLFGKVFDRTGQLEAVLQHVTDSIVGQRQFSTRRAVLVVPHEIQAGIDVAPLGLISVRIVPRFSVNRIVLNFSYTWRTVEALVGFPYSLYGSVKFADYLTERIRERLPTTSARILELGEVSYIAHSLHIFMDEYGQSIARRIVDNASF